MTTTTGYDIATATKYHTQLTTAGHIVWLKNECGESRFVVNGCRTHIGAVAKALRMSAE